ICAESSSLLDVARPLRVEITNQRLIVQTIDLNRNASHVRRKMRKIRDTFRVDKSQTGRETWLLRQWPERCENETPLAKRRHECVVGLCHEAAGAQCLIDAPERFARDKGRRALDHHRALGRERAPGALVKRSRI